MKPGARFPGVDNTFAHRTVRKGAEKAMMGRVSRRNAMGLLGLAGAGAIGTAVAPVARLDAGTALAASAAGHGHEAPPALAQDEMTVDEMDAMHEAGVKSFPAPTEGLGGQPLEFTMDGDVKVFDLVCQVVAVGSGARQAGRGLDLQRRHARAGDPRHRRRQGPRQRHATSCRRARRCTGTA